MHPHADYPAWFRQDRLLFGALVGSLSPPIVPLITNASSSLEAWTILSNTYANPSRGHIKQLQHHLKQSTKSPEQSITDYMQSVKTIIDELSILGKKMDDEDITDAILNGLDSKTYKPVIDGIHARDTPISFHELHEKLINHELSIVQQPLTSPNLHQPATTFAAHNRPSHKSWNSRNNPTSSQGLLPTPQQSNSNTKKYLGTCQFCFNKGHSLTSCYAFKNKYPNIQLPILPRQNNKPQAHVMTTNNSNQNPNPNWIFDSGASHHVTNDLNALSLHAPYDGTGELVIGDGLPLQPNPTQWTS